MRILITGACGFIGSHWIKELKENTDHDIIGIDNLEFGHRDNFSFGSPRCRFEELDITHYKRINKLIDDFKPEIIYHLAAISSLPECQSNPVRTMEVNIGATINLLEQARLKGVAKFIFASSNSLYEENYQLPFREDDRVTPHLIYPVTKKIGEDLCYSYSQSYGLNTICLRFSNVYGCGQDLKRKSPALTSYILDCLLRNESPILHGDGTQTRDYLYIDDLIEFLTLELEDNSLKIDDGFHDIYNICSNTCISVQDIYECFADKLDKYKDSQIEGRALYSREYTYPPIYKPAKEIWNSYSCLQDGVLSINDWIIEEEVNKRTLCSYQKVADRFGWFPLTSFEEGVEKMIASQGEL